MSIDLDVYAVRCPKDLRVRWEQAFADCGMICEFRPDFDPHSWTGGDLVAKLQASPKGFPEAPLYGDQPFIAGCGMDIAPSPEFKEELEDVLARCPRALQGKLKKAKSHFFFTTSMGRAPEAWRFQVFAAATLAKVSDGLLYDPQSAVFHTGTDAVKLAADEAASMDMECARRLKTGKYLNLRRFRSWATALKNTIPEYAE